MMLQKISIRGLILTSIFVSLTISSGYADDSLFLKVLDDANYELGNSFQNFDSALIEEDWYAYGPLLRDIQGTSKEYYEKLSFITVSSKLKNYKEKYLEALSFFQKAGAYGSELNLLMDNGCEQCAMDKFKIAMNEFESGTKLLEESLEIFENYTEESNTISKNNQNSVNKVKPTTEIPISNNQNENLVPKNKISDEICDCSANIYNCKGDFPLPNGATADDCYAYCKSQGKGDVHDLDRNSDGDACEEGWWD